ncbi:hypothetical protein Bcav_3735 [Beutenbergia cavernae DSM 12333]|uniref:Polymerase nucleotidyl transferase domain-containing protein n=1 Tax=Beutenbergia cavernae (strain ATCC BAA-8 / DSM 12333 / CCUG 43141 / JCM 11478 / NBRC 16432 / NCIMB 13614 / HKI 0122) TaxID=471853 RepID=C5C3R8_BEUC1|nr:nucleotidyltransferase domain-containing protein [Beutenbergia cavernae]ACQ81977.1 hypothetical protein Bcav_3735 [Beutenbergia cavernae DSM 12333]
MFTVAERVRVRESLVEAARADPLVTAAALTGSAARDAEDAWSDIDLALRIDGAADPMEVAAAWTARMYADHDAVHHLDVWAGATLFRVFLLRSSLQVDIAFWADGDFGAKGPSWRLLFGTAGPPVDPRPADPESLVGTGWLYALHARASIARGRVIQAAYMLDGVRDQVVSLACARLDLPFVQARGADDLPAELRAAVADTMPRSIERPELERAFAVVARLLLDEAAHVDELLAERLAEPAGSSQGSNDGPRPTLRLTRGDLLAAYWRRGGSGGRW